MHRRSVGGRAPAASLLVLLVGLCMACGPVRAQPTGDYSGDGIVNLADAILTLRAAVGLTTPTPAQLAAVDFNGDGKVDVTDAVAVLQIVVGLRPQPVPAVSLVEVASGLVSPVTLVAPPDGSGRLFIVDQAGVVRVLGKDGTMLPAPFLDVRSEMVSLNAGYDERGLLGLAFHPGFASNGRLFAYYVRPLRAGAPAGWNCTCTVSEFHVSAADPNVVDPTSERVVLQIDHPEANHVGGTIAFGPDGMLYLGMGDGGGANDVGLGHVAGGNGQSLNTLLGKIIRIDVDGGDPYGIPPDNPFAAGGGLPEIYAYGFRNPYRISFDSGGAHELFVGDAGQSRWEEVDIVRKGGDYGWNIREGSHCFDPSNPTVEPPSCPTVGPRGEPLINPIIEFANSAQPGGLGNAVIGGFVYRGTALPALVGRYVFGSWEGASGQRGVLFVGTRPTGDAGTWQMQQLEVAGGPRGALTHDLLGFGEDAAGELYVLTRDASGPSGTTGRVSRLAPATAQ